VIAWVATGVALGSLALSAWNYLVSSRLQRKHEAAADVTVYFHWLPAYSKVRLKSGKLRRAGYNLVLWNRGPSEATCVDIVIYDKYGNPRTLADSPEDEFPIRRLDSGALYPIPWVLDNDSQGESRQFSVDVSWIDGNGIKKHTLPLRRGQIGA
jgi:hypothetical protein